MPLQAPSWRRRCHSKIELRELVAPILIDDRLIVVTADDPVGGGLPVSDGRMPSARKGPGGLCAVHREWLLREGRPTGPLGLGSRGRAWAAVGVLAACRCRCVGRSPTASSKRDNRPPSVVAGLDLPHERDKWPRRHRESRRCLSTHEDRWPMIRAGRKPRTKAETRCISNRLPHLRHRRTRPVPRRSTGTSTNIARDRWRLRRLGSPGCRRAGRSISAEIQQPWLREAIKKFLRWRVDTGHSASGMHRDLTADAA